MKHFKKNQKVMVHPADDNQNYNSFRGQVLIITSIYKDSKDHPGYDTVLSPEYLYDLKTISGKYVPFSLYDFELIKA